MIFLKLMVLLVIGCSCPARRTKSIVRAGGAGCKTVSALHKGMSAFTKNVCRTVYARTGGLVQRTAAYDMMKQNAEQCRGSSRGRKVREIIRKICAICGFRADQSRGMNYVFWKQQAFSDNQHRRRICGSGSFYDGVRVHVG